MSINIVQAIILGLFASLSSMPGLGGTSIGNYTLGRPLVGGLICGIADLRYRPRRHPHRYSGRLRHAGRLHRSGNSRRHSFR